jgi:glycosyltransferase involved in cell wall biosynthesis
MTWAILTGEYPPMPGGVADHSAILAEALAATGDIVHVFVPREVEPRTPPFVRRLPDHYGPAGLARLSQWIDELPAGARLLVQYTPQAFGFAAMNVPFCLWLRTVAHRRPVDVLFHEVHSPIESSQPLRHNVLGAVTRLMSRIVARAARRVFLSTSAWEQLVRPMVLPDVPIRITPVPSNLPAAVPCECITATRTKITRGDARARLIGHFGTYGPWFRKTLGEVLNRLVMMSDLRAVLVGRGSDGFAAELARKNPSLADRIFATGAVPRDVAAAHLAACDLLVQPFIDGITTRRSSAMAGLALGVPVVTNHGPLSEAGFWSSLDAVAMAPTACADQVVAEVQSLLHDAPRRAALGNAGRAAYQRYFHVDRTVEALRRQVER